MHFEPTLAGYDRDVARADADWTAWRRGLMADPAQVKGETPLEPWRHVAGQSTFETIGRLSTSPVDDAWKQGLLRWVLVLIQRRVALPNDFAWAVAAREPSAHVTLRRNETVSWIDAWDGVLRSPERARVEEFLRAAADRGPVLRPLARHRAERRVEVTRQLGLPSAFALGTTMTRDALCSAANALLLRTEDLARACLREADSRGRVPHPVDGLMLAVARDAPEGWPAHLTARWLVDQFPRLTQGLVLQLQLQLPRAVGASSFARALGGFGKAFRRAAPSRSLPFALANDPYDVDAERFALLFASLAASPTFQKRSLKNVERVARSQARTITRAFLIGVRAIAVRALLADDRATGRMDAFDELTSRLFGAPLPGGLSGAWPDPRCADDDGWTRLLAVLTVTPLATELVERFDVDWFDNPRAVEYLRARGSAPARDASDMATVDATLAADVLAKRFEQVLG